jgi:hypothetical protein
MPDHLRVGKEELLQKLRQCSCKQQLARLSPHCCKLYAISKGWICLERGKKKENRHESKPSL